MIRWLCFLLAFGNSSLFAQTSSNDDFRTALFLTAPENSFSSGMGSDRPLSASGWSDGISANFRKGGREFGFSVGLGLGSTAFGSKEAHDLLLSRFAFGVIVTDAVGEQSWYRGNWELLGELSVGGQFHPRSAYAVGFTPVLRYNLASRHRITPFLDLGIGVMVTDIGGPDLSTVFEFNSQGGPGIHWSLTPTMAITAHYRFIHISNARIRYPNHGVNTSILYLGMSWPL